MCYLSINSSKYVRVSFQIVAVIAVTLELSDTWCKWKRGAGPSRVIQEVSNCVVIKHQSQYSLTDLEPPLCELSNDVGINSLGRLLQELRVFPHVFSYSGMDFSSARNHHIIMLTKKIALNLWTVNYLCYNM